MRRSLDISLQAPPLYPIGGADVFGLSPENQGSTWDTERSGGVLVNYGDKFLGWRSNPTMAAWRGLRALDGLLQADLSCVADLRRHVNWVVNHAVPHAPGTAWVFDFDWPEGAARLRAPWISALTQGLAISLLVRVASHDEALAECRCAREDLLGLAASAIHPFESRIEDGGLATRLRGSVVYAEYPARPDPHVLDGFCLALIGLRDAGEILGDPALRLFRQGLQSLEATVTYWDWFRVWSKYGSHGLLCDDHYHLLNTVCLRALGGQAPALVEVANRWDAARRRVLVRRAVAMARWGAYGVYRVRRKVGLLGGSRASSSTYASQER